jgi:multidrug efflux system membrane fusion protein
MNENISMRQSNVDPPLERRRFRRMISIGVVFLLAAAGALIFRMHRPAAQMGTGGPPGMGGSESVAVASAQLHDIQIILSGLGTVTPLATVTVKSQISGYLTQVAFTEGQFVHKGDLLAQVDPRPYHALLEQYEGTLAKDQALLDNARLDLKRYQALIRQDSISGQTVDTQEATVRQYEGAVRTDRGLVEAQKLNLIYCHITSPIDGRVGLRQVDIGNYVESSDTTGITVVTEVAPISVIFVLPEDSVPQLRARLRQGASLPVTAYDRSNTTKIAEGKLTAIDSQFDTSTGTLKLRAIFPNTDDALFPNQFVNARLLLDKVCNVVTVPLAAVQNAAEGKMVYVVEDGNKVHMRKIQTGVADAERVAVTAGLKADERVVVDGANRLQDGATVSIAPAGS